jgi:hypothetical protein
LPVDYKDLDTVLSMMGAKRDLRPLQMDPTSSREKIKFQLKTGVRVAAAEFASIETVAGMFSHNGEHAFLYIDEPYHTEDVLMQKPAESAQRFHLVKHCPSLLAMHNAGKSERYVLIQNSDGEFPSKPLDSFTGRTMIDKVVNAHLMPCKNCLAQLAYQGYAKPGPKYRQRDRQDNDKIFRNFDVKSFFEHYEPFFFDTNFYRKNPNDGKANYTSDHLKIRDQLLIEIDFCCEKCGVQLKDRTSLLHMHHLNSRKGDNRRDNLKILCIICHSLEPNHQHMKPLVKSADALFIRQRLAKQKTRSG